MSPSCWSLQHRERAPNGVAVKKRATGTATSHRSPRGGETTLDQRRHPEAKDIIPADHRAGNAEGAGSEIMQETQVEVTTQTITTA
jgi:hypothetical protein